MAQLPTVATPTESGTSGSQISIRNSVEHTIL